MRIVLPVVTGLKKIAVKWLARLIERKGAALKRAGIEVHHVRPIDTPHDELEDPAEADSCQHYEIELTIHPDPGPAGRKYWNASALLLVKPMTRFEDDIFEDTQVDDACEILAVEVERNGAFQGCEGSKLEGPQRLRLAVAARKGSRQLKFQYYFEQFGLITLPEAETVAAS